MIGDQIRALREEKAWTQAHLADASGISLRTIQRLETLHGCSPETLLSLAAALDVDVRSLTEAGTLSPAATKIPGAVPIALLLTLPALLFIGVNLAKYQIGWAAPYDTLAAAGANFGIIPALDAASPLLLLGGPAVALAMMLIALVRLRITRRGPALALTAVEVYPRWLPLAVGLAAALSLGVLLLYLFVENVPRV